MSAGFMFRN